MAHASRCQPLKKWWSRLWLFSDSHEVGLISYTSSMAMLLGACAHTHSVEDQASASPVFLPSGQICHQNKCLSTLPCLSICPVYISLLLCSPPSMGFHFYWEERLGNVSASPWVTGRAQGFLGLTPGSS